MGTLHVEERGRGAPVVLLHDTPCRPEHMRKLADRLPDRFRVVVVHRPGYGRSQPLEPYSLERVLLMIEETLAERRIRDGHFVGFGVGAYLALSLACRARVRAHSVACLGGGAAFDAQAERFAAWAAMLHAGTDLRLVVEATALSPRGRENAAATADVCSWVDGRADAVARELEALLLAPDLHSEVAWLRVPILARVGSVDAACPPEVVRRLVDFARDITFEEIAGVGHALLWEDLDETSASVTRHLRAAEELHATATR